METEEGDGDAEASGEEKAMTSSTSVMSESDQEYCGSTMKAESPDSVKTEAVVEPEAEAEAEAEPEPTMPLFNPAVVSPKPKSENTESSIPQ